MPAIRFPGHRLLFWGSAHQQHVRSDGRSDRRQGCLFDHIPDVTPNFTHDEFNEVDEAMRANPDVVAALAKRGFTNMDLILIDVTYGKALMPEKYRDRRLGWCDLWARETYEGNPYGHPVSGSSCWST